ncbi:hypothetical protein FRC12_014158 [Ceratobasidium sp. 428]|nr:hypothetical protein FRC09_000656 [Ceratobasidium sp. 395]KAG8788844.1 hypothetical protein FRC12_014158 [Ceratobasidium sp. 428]
MNKGALEVRHDSRASDTGSPIRQCEAVIVVFQGRLTGICHGFGRLRNDHRSIRKLGRIWDQGTQLTRDALEQLQRAIKTLVHPSESTLPDRRDLAYEVGGLLELLLKAQNMLGQSANTRGDQTEPKKRYRKRPWWLAALAFMRDLLALIAAVTSIIPAVNAVVPFACLLGSALAGIAYTIAKDHLQDKHNAKRIKDSSGSHYWGPKDED